MSLIYFLVYCLSSLAKRKVSKHCCWFGYYLLLFAILGALEMLRNAEGGTCAIRLKNTVWPQLSMGKALWDHLKGERLVHRTQRALWRRCSSPCLAETLPCRGIICNSLKKSIQFNLISALGVTSTAIINVQQSTLRLMAVRLLPSHTAYLTTHFKLHPKSQQEHSMSTEIQAKLQQMELDDWWTGGIKKEVRGKKIISTFYLCK